MSQKLLQGLRFLKENTGAPQNTGECLACKPAPKLEVEPDYTLHHQQNDNETTPPMSTPVTHPAGINPVKEEFHFGAVDWFAVGVNLIGIAGDVGLISTAGGNLSGPEVWLFTEGVEIVGIGRDIYKNDNDAVGKDVGQIALSAFGEARRSAVLVPVLGFAANAANILEAFRQGYVKVPIQ